MSTATCPSCGRSNAAHRAACLYCGGLMPNPTAPPPPKAPAFDAAELDQLVREAMRGGSVEAVKAAIEARKAKAAALEAEAAARGTPPGPVGAPPSPAPPGVTGVVHPAAPAAGHPAPPAAAHPTAPAVVPPAALPRVVNSGSAGRAPARPAPPPPGFTDVGLALDHLQDLVRSARFAHRRGEAAELRALLGQVRAAAAALPEPRGPAEPPLGVAPPVGAAPAVPPSTAAAAGPLPAVPPLLRGAPPVEALSALLPGGDPPSAPVPLDPELHPELVSALDPPSGASVPEPKRSGLAPVRMNVPLPPIRFRHALVLDGVGDAERAPRLAAALGVDIATARALALVRTVNPALRSDDAELLERRARQVWEELRLVARVVARAEVAAIPVARPLLGMRSDGVWLYGVGDLWTAEPDRAELLGTREPDLDAVPLGRFGGTRLDEVLLITVGEVATKLIRPAAATAKWDRERMRSDHVGTERRRGVVDLHTADAIWRVSEPLTELRSPTEAWASLPEPGAPPEPSLRGAFGRFLEAAARRWPGVPVEPRRVTAATHELLVGDEQKSLSGWPAWEEYTRFVRILRGVGR